MAAQKQDLLAGSVKDAAVGALVAFGLFAMLIGMKTDVSIGGLSIEYRWGAVAIAVAVVFVGRLALNLFVWKSEKPVTAVLGGFVPSQEAASRFGHLITPALFVLAVVLPFLLMYFLGSRGSRQYLDLAILVTTYVMLGWGLNIVVGLAGLLDLGYVAFYAVGAYSYALLAQYFGFSFWLCLPLAGILAAFWGVILGFPVLRLRGDYLAIVTLAFGEIIRLVLINWREVTNGAAGISGIPKVSFFGVISFNVSDPNYISKVFGIAQSGAYYKIFLYYLILALCVLTGYVTIRLRRLPVGRAWEALREDEIACRSLGINTTTTKLTAFAIGAMFGGFAGSFFAARQGFVSPESFIFLESAIILAIVVLGGMGSLGGIAVAAAVMVGGTEILREMQFLKQIFGPDFTPELYRMLLFGAAMVIVMVWKPRGFVGSREPTAFLKERKAVAGSFTKEGHG